MNTPAPPRRSFKAQMHEARAQAIVAAAGRLLGEKGFEAMTLEEVAAEVGVAKASLYKHFAGKEELCATAMAQAVGRLGAFLDGLPADLPAFECLRELLRWLLSQQLTDELPLMLARNSGLRGPLKDCAAYQAALQEVSARATEWIAAAQREGRLSEALPCEVILYSLYARSADPLLSMLRERGGYTDGQIVDWAVQACFDGLKSRSTP
ncbi:TetR/AcrR family transcriptional regulator [Acidovorax sp. PRC11]|uniref:TetR/AcrR family transcriptional regulator n=1 Tax=Acidovorax sp. PRC11 TaxID=2962592 RepID=UPI0028821E3E|nr:TetR/AcrR family transcriptional regulator [Acidovorax sp. PRC11]MDT0138988.1 TetR/AcrR family transcriptional regulator [Acidovorax sp. PRC11]